MTDLTKQRFTEVLTEMIKESKAHPDLVETLQEIRAKDHNYDEITQLREFLQPVRSAVGGILTHPEADWQVEAHIRVFKTRIAVMQQMA